MARASDSNTAASVAASKLVDNWPSIKSAAEWNLEEKEKEIRENLAKMAGINIGSVTSSLGGGKQSATQKGAKSKQSSSHMLMLTKQY